MVDPENIKPNNRGRIQFNEHQSLGKYKLNFRDKPDYLDDYFFVLRDGKRTLDLISREYHQMFVKGEWWGLYQIWLDWRDHRYLLLYVLKWYKKETNNELPKWMSEEEIENG